MRPFHFVKRTGTPGLRREELVNVDLDQVSPQTPAALRRARQGRITRVQGKGKTERTVFLFADARAALADYLERERPRDANEQTTALCLSAVSLPARSSDGRLSPWSINLLLEQIGRGHDAELADLRRRISPLRPQDLRHTFAFHLAQVTGADAYDLERLVFSTQPAGSRVTTPLASQPVVQAQNAHRQVVPGFTGPVTVPLAVADSCGPWQTFVGFGVGV